MVDLLNNRPFNIRKAGDQSKYLIWLIYDIYDILSQCTKLGMSISNGYYASLSQQLWFINITIWWWLNMSISLGVPSPGEARVQALAILRVLGGSQRSMGNIIHDYLMRNLIFLKFTIITNGLLFLSIGDPDLNLDPRCRARKSLRNRRWASLAKIMTKCELSESQ